MQSLSHQKCSFLVLTLRSCCDIYFWIFICTLRLENPKRIWKTVPKNSGLAHERIINKKNSAVHENSLQILFRISHRTAKRKSMKSGFGFLNWNPPWGQISRRWNPFSDFVFVCKIRNPDSQQNARERV